MAYIESPFPSPNPEQRNIPPIIFIPDFKGQAMLSPREYTEWMSTWLVERHKNRRDH